MERDTDPIALTVLLRKDESGQIQVSPDRSMLPVFPPAIAAVLPPFPVRHHNSYNLSNTHSVQGRDNHLLLLHSKAYHNHLPLLLLLLMNRYAVQQTHCFSAFVLHGYLLPQKSPTLPFSPCTHPRTLQFLPLHRCWNNHRSVRMHQYPVH